MTAKNESTLLVSDKDYELLNSLVSTNPTEAMFNLDEELAKATVMPADQMPSDVVTMHSRVRVMNLDTKTESELTLVLPHEADITSNKVSILAPMGTALIGLRVGQSYEWPMPSGKCKRFEVVAVTKPTENE